MENINIYENIGKRTGGDIYIGVVGPVRAGKSTFIKRFMDLMVIPNVNNAYEKQRLTRRDATERNRAGPVMTTEPKFIPADAAEAADLGRESQPEGQDGGLRGVYDTGRAGADGGRRDASMVDDSVER